MPYNNLVDCLQGGDFERFVSFATLVDLLAGVCLVVRLATICMLVSVNPPDIPVLACCEMRSVIRC